MRRRDMSDREIQKRAARHGAVPREAARHEAVQSGAARHEAVQHGTVQGSAVRKGAGKRRKLPGKTRSRRWALVWLLSCSILAGMLAGQDYVPLAESVWQEAQTEGAHGQAQMAEGARTSKTPEGDLEEVSAETVEYPEKDTGVLQQPASGGSLSMQGTEKDTGDIQAGGAPQGSSGSRADMGKDENGSTQEEAGLQQAKEYEAEIDTDETEERDAEEDETKKTAEDAARDIKRDTVKDPGKNSIKDSVKDPDKYSEKDPVRGEESVTGRDAKGAADGIAVRDSEGDSNRETGIADVETGVETDVETDSETEQESEVPVCGGDPQHGVRVLAEGLPEGTGLLVRKAEPSEELYQTVVKALPKEAAKLTISGFYEIKMEHSGETDGQEALDEAGQESAELTLYDSQLDFTERTRLLQVYGEGCRLVRELACGAGADGGVRFRPGASACFLFVNPEPESERAPGPEGENGEEGEPSALKGKNETGAPEALHSEGEAGTESMTEGTVDLYPEGEAESETESEIEHETERGTKNATESSTENETEHETGNGTESDTESDTESMTEEWEVGSTEEVFSEAEGGETIPDEVLIGLMVRKAAPSSQTAEVSNGKKIYVPAGWRILDGSPLGYTVRYTAKIEDRQRTAYCLEPPKNGGEPGKYKAERLQAKGPLSAKEAGSLKRALFYLYGGPGWDAAGIKAILQSCSTNEDYYVASHFILSKLYCEATGGTWNEITSGVERATAVNGTGIKEINKAIAKLKDLPEPSASLSTTAVKGSYNAVFGGAVSESITYASSVGKNSLSVKVPDGISVIVADKEYTAGTSAKIEPGQSFRFKKKGYTAAHNQTITLTAAVFTDYEGYIIYTKEELQSKGFSFVADKKYSVTVRWPELKGKLELEKTSADAGFGEQYDFAGTQYTVYQADGKTVYKVLSLDAKGRASLPDIPYGNYQIRETKVPANGAYRQDTAVYKIQIPDASGAAQIKVMPKEEPRRISLRVSKRAEKIEGTEGTGTFIRGIRFTLTHTKKAIPPVSKETDEKGFLEFPGIPMGTYQLTEDVKTVPKGYKAAEPLTVIVKGSAQDVSKPLQIECAALNQEGTIVVINKPLVQHGEAVPEVQKRLKAGKLRAEQFIFRLFGPDGMLMQSKQNDKDGKVLFDRIAYTGADAGKTYVYRIEEAREGEKGVEYDERTVYLSVKVEYGDPQSDQLDIRTAYFSDKDLIQRIINVPVFENVLRPVVRIRKEGASGGGLLGGARFCLMDKDGRVLEEWTSREGKEYELTCRLELGTAYVVRELEAPEGYSKAEDLEFVTKEDNLLQVITVKNRRQLLVPAGVSASVYPAALFLLAAISAWVLAGKRRRRS